MEVVSPAQNYSRDDLVTKDAAHLALAEMAVGGFAHSIHMPFVGHLLSLNQGAFLCHAARNSAGRRAAARACFEISGVAATFKSLSPVGKKLGPMLSLMMQGLLFALGVLVFGKNRLGQMFGFFLLCLWAFVMPFFTLLISLGPHMIRQVVQFYWQRLSVDYSWAGWAVISVVLAVVLAKFLAAGALVTLLNRLSQDKWEGWQQRILSISNGRSELEVPESKRRGPWRLIYRDLTRPLFIFSMLLTWIFLFVQSESNSQFVWQALRPVGVAFLLIYILRHPALLALLERAAARTRWLSGIQSRFKKVQVYLSAQSVDQYP